LGGIGGLLRSDVARDSRRSGGINGSADLQAFRPLQTRIVPHPVFWTRGCTMRRAGGWCRGVRRGRRGG
jgi:hypothetical protein